MLSGFFYCFHYPVKPGNLVGLLQKSTEMTKFSVLFVNTTDHSSTLVTNKTD